MKHLRVRFWFAVMDAIELLGHGEADGWRFRLYLWALGKASDATDWGVTAIDVDIDDRETPF